MKFKFSLLTLLLSSIFVNAAPLEENIKNCTSCHLTVQPGESFDYKDLVAPPFMGVMRHVKFEHPTKEQAIDFIVDYVKDPEGMRSHAVCAKRTIQRFGYMPAGMQGNMTDDELREIADYLYNTYGNVDPHKYDKK